MGYSGGGGSCDANCPDATYMFAWNGDHSTAEEYACITDCSASQDHSGDDEVDRINSTAGHTGQGFEFTDLNQYIYWTITADDILSDSEGTIWFDIYTASTMTESMRFLEIYPDSSNNIRLVLSTADKLLAYFESTTGGEETIGSTGTITTSAWNRIRQK